MPHQNWRGQFARGTFASGTRAGQSSDCTTYPPSNGCLPISWPGWATTAWHDDAGKQPTTGYAHYWFGSQAVGMRDASGQMYMRNRYYDPATGQFTQPDPIGLAGGLNSYGFAAGDPVSYSDPYGLSVCDPPDDPDCPKSAAAGTAAYVGSQVADGGDARVRYNAEVGSLDPNDTAGRSAAKTRLQAETPRLPRALIQATRGTSTGPRLGSTGRANITNSGWNAAGAIGRFGGRGLVVIAVVVGVDRVANSDNPGRETTQVLGGLAGGVGGEIVGAAGGSALGPVGTVGGGIVGGAVGGAAGDSAGGKLYDWITGGNE